MKKKKFRNIPKNIEFIDSMLVNDATYFDYLERFKKIALSMFEWENLPKSMNVRYLEECLYYKGQASLLEDEKFGFINTQCCSNGQLNIYGLPTSLNCFSFGYQADRKLYTGLNNEEARKDSCILVMNNWECIPTASTIELFAYRLYEAERTCDVNIKAQKTPVLVVVDESQRLTMENLYSQYDGNKPVIFGDKNQLQNGMLKAISTEAPVIFDKVSEYKKEIWNEALTFLGIQNIAVNKKERLVSDEANYNNEVTNLNLQSFLIPRQEACKKFNELFGLTGTENEIKVKVRSDLYNIIKQELSIVKDYNNDLSIDESEDNENE